MKNRKYYWLAGSVVALAAALLLWRSFSSAPLQVWVSAAEMGAVEATVSNTRAGTIKACRRSRLSMPIGGVVDRLLVEEGQQVVAGQLLLELWNKDRLADVTQAEQLVAAAERDRQTACLLAEHREREAERVRTLRQRKLASEENLDSAETAAHSQRGLCESASNQLGVARARLQLQRAILERSRLHAPFSGTVAEINGEVGEYITPSPPGIPTPAAIDLIDYSCLYVAAPIDEIDASRVALGQQARISLDAFRDRELSGTVRRIAPYVLDLERQARTVEVEVQLDALPAGVKLLVGYSADISLLLEQREQTLRIPSEALLPGDKIWVLDQDNLLRQRQLQLGISNWAYSEVLSGLRAGEWVVLSPDQEGIAEGVNAEPKLSGNTND